MAAASLPMPPGAAMAPPSAQVMSSSVDFLGTMDGIFMKQQIEVLEALTGCETKNRYHLTPVPQGTPDPTPKEWLNNFKQNAQYQPFMSAKEESECFERICCSPFRGFNLPFVDTYGRAFLTVQRPFKCDCCYIPPCYTCTQQEVKVTDAQGMTLAIARERSYCCTSCCTRSFDAMDATGNLIYTIQASECSSSRGCNVFAPSCCNESYDVDVLDAQGKLISTSSWVFPGCNCAGLTEVTNSVLRFPKNATPQQRAALLGGMLLVEYAVIEFRTKKNNNN